MSKRLRIVALITMISILLTGCWDRIEINERDYVIIMGMDLAKQHKGEEASELKNPYVNRYAISYSMPNLKTVQTGSEHPEEANFVFKTEAQNPYEASVQFANKMSTDPYYKHCKITVFGSNLVKDPIYLRELLDGLLRNNQLTRKLNLFVAQGDAYDILSTNPKMIPKVGEYLWRLAYKKNVMSIYVPQTLDEVATSLEQYKTALIPRVTATKDEIKVAGSAAIKDYRFIGWLGEKETRSVAFLKERSQADIFDVPYKEVDIPYIVDNIRVRRKAKIEDDKISMDIMIATSGGIQQYLQDEKPELMNSKIIKEIEKSAEKRIKREIDFTINKLQGDLNIDLIGIGEHLSKFEPDLWESIRDDWDSIFPKVDINVKVDARIRRIGSIR
ncbi:spore germination protein, Ger(X)C family [Gottschalkia purinilytica]|uniref:Spore germination protein, Ger(X)C family n=1 Tax=Gottschalkia purinilytica TaxID=1503 RepID=A0A0L0WEC8_GOTPU|nr:Ger(x)C family spore germination protein [Gottschalkia purinilytica]KNF09780.1 spore germination protein, Ger(X)C family [Gottschalkia purinilytica]